MLYFRLFASMADAVELLEQGRWEQAKLYLIRAQQEAEERFLEQEED